MKKTSYLFLHKALFFTGQFCYSSTEVWNNIECKVPTLLLKLAAVKVHGKLSSYNPCLDRYQTLCAGLGSTVLHTKYYLGVGVKIYSNC